MSDGQSERDSSPGDILMVGLVCLDIVNHCDKYVCVRCRLTRSIIGRTSVGVLASFPGQGLGRRLDKELCIESTTFTKYWACCGSSQLNLVPRPQCHNSMIMAFAGIQQRMRIFVLETSDGRQVAMPLTPVRCFHCWGGRVSSLEPSAKAWRQSK